MLGIKSLFSIIGPSHKAVISASVLQEAASRFQLEKSLLKPVRTFPSAVYNFLDTSYLKIIPESERSIEELAWIYYWQEQLSEELNFVSPLKQSRNGHYLERIEFGERNFTAVLLQAAMGIPVIQKNWNPSTYYKLGKLTGALHQATHRLSESEKIKTKGIVEGHLLVHNIISKHLKPEETDIHQRCAGILEQVQLLPKSNNNYGLIHNDIHRGNLMIHHGQLTLFDFDDACQSWFINDISCIFYHALLNTWKPFEFSTAPMKMFRSYFWKGYHEHYRLSDTDRESLPKWIALRALSEYAFQIKCNEHLTRNPTLRAYFVLTQKYARLELEKKDPGYFIE